MGNIGTSPSISFRMNQPPIIDSIVPVNGSEFTDGSVISFKVLVHDPDSDSLLIEWVLDDSDTVFSTDFEFENATIPLGDHRITVIVRDNYYTVQETIDLIVKKEPKVGSDHSGYYVIIILIILLLSLILILHMKYRKD